LGLELEFILNVRDSDKLIPVFIVGMNKDKEEKQVLSKTTRYILNWGNLFPN
jgi:hypothetical protein